MVITTSTRVLTHSALVKHLERAPLIFWSYMRFSKLDIILKILCLRVHYNVLKGV